MNFVLSLFVFFNLISASAQAQTASGRCADAVQSYATEEMDWQSASVYLISQQELQQVGDEARVVSEIYELFGRRRMSLSHVGRMQGLEAHLFVQAMTSIAPQDSDGSACEMQVIHVNP